jgi:4-hydroxybenzoate polyprenyltransferase
LKSASGSPEPIGFAPVTSAAFWRGYWLTLRPYLLFVSGVSGLLGLALAEGLSWPALVAAGAAFFLAYGLGQALTDVFQTDTDALSAPYRPLVQGLISPRQVLLISLAGLGLCALVLAALNPLTLALSALAVFGLLSYTWFKRRWWGGPCWNAWIVALLPLLGYLCGGASLSAAICYRPLQAAMASVFFGYAVFVLLGYFKDISADRASGYWTLPVVFGRRVSVLASALFALAATAAGVWFWQHLPPSALALIVWLAGVFLLGWAHRIMMRLSEREAYRSIALAVRGFVLLQLGLVIAAGPELAAFGLALYALFEVALRARPETAQI